MANDVLKRLEMGGSKIAQQHDAVQKALQEVNKRIEDTHTHTELNRDSGSTEHDFRAYAAQVQHNTEKTKVELKRFAEDVQSATAQSTSPATGATIPSGRRITLKETSVDRLPEAVARADFSKWVEELCVLLERVDGWRGFRPS